MNQLQQLHGELNIAKTAGPEFYLRVELRVGDVFGHSLAHFLRRLNEALPSRRCPDLGRECCNISLTKHHVTGDWSRLQKCLKLPALSPSVVVGNVRI